MNNHPAATVLHTTKPRVFVRPSKLSVPGRTLSGTSVTAVDRPVAPELRGYVSATTLVAPAIYRHSNADTLSSVATTGPMMRFLGNCTMEGSDITMAKDVRHQGWVVQDGSSSVGGGTETPCRPNSPQSHSICAASLPFVNRGQEGLTLHDVPARLKLETIRVEFQVSRFIFRHVINAPRRNCHNRARSVTESRASCRTLVQFNPRIGASMTRAPGRHYSDSGRSIHGNAKGQVSSPRVRQDCRRNRTTYERRTTTDSGVGTIPRSLSATRPKVRAGYSFPLSARGIGFTPPVIRRK